MAKENNPITWLLSWAFDAIGPNYRKPVGWGIIIALIVGWYFIAQHKKIVVSPIQATSTSASPIVNGVQINNTTSNNYPLKSGNQVLNAPKAAIATINQNGNNTVNMTPPPRELSPSEKSQVDECLSKFNGTVPLILATGGDGELAHLVLQYARNRMVEDATSVYDDPSIWGIQCRPRGIFIGQKVY